MRFSDGIYIFSVHHTEDIYNGTIITYKNDMIIKMARSRFVLNKYNQTNEIPSRPFSWEAI